MHHRDTESTEKTHATIVDVAETVADVGLELQRAIGLHPRLNSAHEAYAVILEELEEFWSEVMKKSRDRSIDAMRTELIQIAAMACRTIIDLQLDRHPDTPTPPTPTPSINSQL